jgi:hypothetical protein
MQNPTDEELIQRFLATEGIPVDPMLPSNWDGVSECYRPKCHWLLRNRPYITTVIRNGQTMDSVRYAVRMLDNKCWDRSTWYGSYASLDDAITKAESLVK